MIDQATDDASDRIERAITRIEAAARRTADARRTLSERHNQLRARVGDALADLDSLIAGEDD